MWSGTSTLLPKLMLVKSFLPSGLQKVVDQLMKPPDLSQTQIARIVSLGRDIGLEDDEVVLAMEPTGVGLPDQHMSKAVYALSTLVVFVAAIIVFVAMWHLVSPETSPIPTYAPGTFYGTIKPQDFTPSNLHGI